jgi:predicted DNA binding CopG/RHH family protein
MKRLKELFARSQAIQVIDSHGATITNIRLSKSDFDLVEQAAVARGMSTELFLLEIITSLVKENNS